MKYILPEEVTETMLVSSTVPLDDYTTWVAGEYTTGDEVRYDLSAYRAATTTTDRPDQGAEKDPKTWVRLGYVNRWRGLRDGPDSKTLRVGGVQYVIQAAETVTAVSVQGCEGFELELTMEDATAGVVYNETKKLLDYEVDNLYDYLFKPPSLMPDAVFEDLPPYRGAKITIEARGGDETQSASIGRFSMGIPVFLGDEEWGTTISGISGSVRERDGFQNLTIVPGRFIPVVNFRLVIDTPDLDRVRRALVAVADIPCPYIGDGEYSATTLFGTPADFRLTLPGVIYSYATLEIEGY